MGENLAIFFDEADGDLFIFFGDFDAALPDHFLPVVEVVLFGGGERGYFEDGDSFGFVAVDEFRGVDHLK